MQFIKDLSTYTTTILFWLSIIGTVFLFVHPKISNYVVPGKKTFSFLQASTLMFTGLYSSSILYWSFFENILFKDDVNFIALFPDKVGNPYFLTSMTLYNWGLSLFTIVFIGAIICLFIAKFGNKYIAPKYKYLLIIVYAFLAIFSTTRIMASLASYIIPLKFLLNYFSGINSNIFIVVILVATILWSALGGIQHIKKLANVCAIIVAVFTIIFTAKLFLLNDGSSYILNVVKEFSFLVIDKDFISAQFQFNNDYIKDWTILFSTLQIVCVFPAIYFFYLIMQGRTVREFVLLYILSTILPTFLVFTINSSLVQILSGANNIILTPDNFFDMYKVIFDYIGLGNFSAIILFLSMFTLIVTSVDSIIYAVSKYLGIHNQDHDEEEKTKKKSKAYIIFAIGFVAMLGGFLLYVLSFKSKPAIAVRLYELNFFASIIIFLPFLYMTYKVIASFHKKDKV